ncbi:MAG TPA: hypothetical protein VMU61_07875 [Candidatus Aquilonibacter sp.]|nr:hypothetical protein [Candidatus Aquilonibacter sp.]
MKTVKDVELHVQTKVTEVLKEVGLLPDGYQCRVRLHGKERDKRRTASFATSWSPDTDSINIRFKPVEEQPEENGVANIAVTEILVPGNAIASAASPSDRLSDLVRALDRLESRPGYDFVALKWFRDTALPGEGFSWANADSERQDILREAIDKRMILTSKVPNPRSPQFPVTAIRLNRLLPDVKAVLGNQSDGLPDFQPVAIRGENLSATILRDRR